MKRLFTGLSGLFAGLLFLLLLCSVVFSFVTGTHSNIWVEDSVWLAKMEAANEEPIEGVEPTVVDTAGVGTLGQQLNLLGVFICNAEAKSEASILLDVSADNQYSLSESIQQRAYTLIDSGKVYDGLSLSINYLNQSTTVQERRAALGAIAYRDEINPAELSKGDLTDYITKQENPYFNTHGWFVGLAVLLLIVSTILVFREKGGKLGTMLLPGGAVVLAILGFGIVNDANILSNLFSAFSYKQTESGIVLPFADCAIIKAYYILTLLMVVFTILAIYVNNKAVKEKPAFVETDHKPVNVNVNVTAPKSDDSFAQAMAATKVATDDLTPDDTESKEE